MHLDDLPRLGLVDAPSPVTALPELAAALGLSWLGVKRDDLLSALFGSTKVRKLDHLLATPPWRASPRWASVGAIGSGHLVALTAAAAALGRTVVAHVFPEPLSEGVEENLAFTASGPTELVWHRSRLTLALTCPKLLLSKTRGDVILPGATHPAALVGLVRAAFELAAQVRSGVLPHPERVLVPLGSGGTLAGLAVGLAAAGLPCELIGVSVVERPLAGRRRLHSLMDGLRAYLASLGVATPPPCRPSLIYDQVGPGYGVPTPASLEATARLKGAGIPQEPIYSGKATAHLLAHAPAGRRVLLWGTPRRGPLPASANWQDALPPPLRRHLNGPG